MDWIEVGKPLRDILDELVSGVVLDMDDHDGTRIKLLVGNINASTGTCGCCGMQYDTNMVHRKAWIDWQGAGGGSKV